MENEITITISVNGQPAVDLARKINGGRCCSIIGDDLAQMEIGIDDDGEYNGLPQKWVDFSYIRIENLNSALNEIKRLGFSGRALLFHEQINGCSIETLSETRIVL